MRSDILAPALLIIVVVGLWALGLARMGFMTSPDVRAWNRIALLRGLARPPTRLQRVAGRSAVVRRARDELDLRRLLVVAGRAESETAFLTRTAFLALLTLTVALVADAASRVGGGEFFVSPILAIALALAVVLLRFSALRGAARRSRDSAGRTLGDMMMLVAIMTDGRGLQVEDAVRILARCARTQELSRLVEGGWRGLVPIRPRNTSELYRAIAQEFGIGQFVMVADAVNATNVGVAERETYTRVANAVYQQRLAEARTRAARARILVTLPVAGMLIPLLLLLGAPTFQSITSGLGGG